MPERKIFRELISVDEALDIILSATYHGDKLERTALEASGHVSAENVYARSDSPPFSRSEMDGYAVRSLDTVGADELTPVRLKVVGRIEADQLFDAVVEPGGAVEVATGSPMPVGCDAVVRVEDTREEGDEVHVFRAVRSFHNTLEAGRDFARGDILFWKGRRITPARVGALCAAGVSKLKVHRRPLVGILSTGSELVEPGSELARGKIYESNSQMLLSSVEQLGADARFLGIVEDEMSELTATVKAAVSQCDCVLLSGGSSAGRGDLAYRVFEKLGGEIRFHGVAVRPGKPTGFGLIFGKPVFVLSGNPMSCYVTFRLFVEPLLRKWLDNRARRRFEAVLSKRHFPARGRREFLPVKLISDDVMTVFPLGGSSGAISRVLEADGTVEIPRETEHLYEGTKVQVEPKEEYSVPDLFLFGYSDEVLQRCVGEMWRRKEVRIGLLEEGSSEAVSDATRFNGLVALPSAAAGQVLPEGFNTITEYSKSFGLAFPTREIKSSFERGQISPTGLKCVSRIPWSIEGEAQTQLSRNTELNLVGYASTEDEALWMLDNGYCECAFTYRTRDRPFLELARIHVQLMAPVDLEDLPAVSALRNLWSDEAFSRDVASRFPYLSLP